MKSLIPQLCWGEWSKWKRKGYNKKASYATRQRRSTGGTLRILGLKGVTSVNRMPEK